MFTGELDRLRDDTGGEAPPRGWFLETARARHDEPAQALQRIRDLLLAVVPPMAAGAADAAFAAAPPWFREACRPEWNREEAEAEMDRWRALSWERQAEEARTEQWSLGGWLACLDPEVRSWWWWAGRVEPDRALAVEVLVEGSPYSSGSLDWMLRAAGCRDVALG